MLDCAHGATYRVAPRVFRGLGARGADAGGAARPGPTSTPASGALHPERLQTRVRARPGPVGSRVRRRRRPAHRRGRAGAVRDGDYVLAICGRRTWRRAARSRAGAVVTTVMANIGLERALGALGVGIVADPVGDRYVLEEMLRLGANLGGEQSGHLIFLDHAPTGDGLVSALQLLRVRARDGPAALGAGRRSTKFPQVLVNVRVRASRPRRASRGGGGRWRAGRRSSTGARGSCCATRGRRRWPASWWRGTTR